jgi:hypothetical protein
MSDFNSSDLEVQMSQLVTKYNFAWDEGRFDDVASCFTPEGVFVDATGSSHEGREAIVDFGRLSTSIFGSMRHLTMNHAISSDGSKWIHRCYILFVWGLDTPEKTSTTGRYEDEFVVTDEGPLFTKRHVILDP